MIANPIPVLGIPHYNRPDLLLRCIESINYPVENLVIVLNAPDANLSDLNSCKIPCVKKAHIIRHPNAGVAGSWNEIIKLFPAPYWMLANNDIQFSHDDLDAMVDFMEKRGVGDLPGCYYGNHGASWWAVTAHGIEQVGLFDENFYPAYLEDCDWSYRADMLGVPRVTVPDCHAIHGDGKLSGSCTVNSDPIIRQKNVQTHSANFGYYEAKWGGRNEQEKFKTPFNDPHWPIPYWKFEPGFRAAQQW